MFKKNLFFKILILILLSACFSFNSPNHSITDPNKVETNKKISQEQKAKFEREIISSATQSFISSLEMKENVEFLLTPALLMQETMSSEILITYPTE